MATGLMIKVETCNHLSNSIALQPIIVLSQKLIKMSFTSHSKWFQYIISCTKSKFATVDSSWLDRKGWGYM